MNNNIIKIDRPDIDYEAVEISSWYADYIAALERIASLPLMKRIDCAQYIADQIIQLGNFRSLRFLLMFHDRNELEVIEDLSFSHLENGRKTPNSRVRQYRQDLGRIISLDFEPENASSLVAKDQTILAINNGENAPKGFTTEELATLKGRAVYFVPIVCDEVTEGVFATGSNADDFEDTYRMIYELEGYLRCCAAQLRNAREYEERERNRILVEKMEVPNLSSQEKKILQLLGSECTDIEICEELEIKRTTLNSYKSRIGEKTGKRTKIQMVKLAYMLGLVPLE